MKKDRRSFIYSTGIAAGAAIIGKVSARDEFAGLTTLEEKAARLVSGYGEVTGREKAADGSLQIQATRVNHQRMRRLLCDQGRLPFGEVRVVADGCLLISDNNERVMIRHIS